MKLFFATTFFFLIQLVVPAQDIAKHNAQIPAQEDHSTSMTAATAVENKATIPVSRKIVSLAERFTVFHPLQTDEIYSITIAADVPDNDRPHKVYVKQEPGHVFIILEQKDTIKKTTIAQVWGFYPVRPVSSILFKNVRCELNDNGKRKYDAAITRQLSAAEFDLIRAKAIELAQKKYNINKYNCYDYAIELFNAIPGIEPLPVTHVKFPFIFGRGGSPCGLYRDLQNLKASNSAWASSIRIEPGRAPASYGAPVTHITTIHQ